LKSLQQGCGRTVSKTYIRLNRMIMLMRMRLTGYVAQVTEKSYAYRALIGKRVGERPRL
jgi:hypothetical protein